MQVFQSIHHSFLQKKFNSCLKERFADVEQRFQASEALVISLRIGGRRRDRWHCMRTTKLLEEPLADEEGKHEAHQAGARASEREQPTARGGRGATRHGQRGGRATRRGGRVRRRTTNNGRLWLCW